MTTSEPTPNGTNGTKPSPNGSADTKKPSPTKASVIVPAAEESKPYKCSWCQKYYTPAPGQHPDNLPEGTAITCPLCNVYYVPPPPGPQPVGWDNVGPDMPRKAEYVRYKRY